MPALALSVVTLAAVTACAGGGGSKTAGPNWSPQPGYTLEPNQQAPLAGGSASEAPSTTATPTPGSTPAPSSGAPSAVDPVVVASNLTAPIGIAVLPDGTALVGQRTTGVIVQVQATAGEPVAVVRTIPGIDASGDGGLLDLALSPNYGEDHLIFAYITTATDNRVVEFTLTGPITPVYVGIPKGVTGNGGRIAFTASGQLLIGTGDTGQPALAQNPASLAGKVLEVTDVGQPVTPGAPVLAQGFHSISGLCVDPDTGAIFETEPAAAATAGTAATGDEINLITKGADYGWPAAAANGVAAIATLPATATGVAATASGCTVTGGALYVTSLAGGALYAGTITAGTGAAGTSVTIGTMTP